MKDFPFNRMRGRLTAWRRIGAPSRVLRWIHSGVPLPWGPAGPPRPFDLGEYPLRTAAEREAWRTLRREYLDSGALVQVTPSSDSCVSRAFLVEKGMENGVMKYRLCVDLRRINRHLKKYGLRYEKLKDFGHLLKKNDFLVGFDIKDAYHHLRMRLSDERFLQFRMDGELFACRALPFGLSLSPYYFTHLMLVVARFLRAPGLCPKAAPKFRFGVLAGNDAISSYFRRFSVEDPALLLAYLDDFLAAMSDEVALREWVCLVKGIFQALGLQFKEKNANGSQSR